MIFRSPPVLNRLTPNLDRDEACLPKQRRHLLSAVAAGTVVGGRQLEVVGSGCFQFLVPDCIGHRHTLGAPSNRTHRAAWLQHAIDFSETAFGARNVKQDEDEGDDGGIESVCRKRQFLHVHKREPTPRVPVSGYAKHAVRTIDAQDCRTWSRPPNGG